MTSDTSSASVLPSDSGQFSDRTVEVDQAAADAHRCWSVVTEQDNPTGAFDAPAAQEALAWLARRLGWERRLDHLRVGTRIPYPD
jgi:hypothetical protein